MRRTLFSAAFLAVMLAAAAFTTSSALAEPRMEVHPPRSHCVVPFEIFAFELEPSKDVLVDMVVGGVVTGSVGGRSEPDGRFWSPIPMVLLPCGPGGVVTANLRIDGQVVVSTTFEVAPPIEPPATVTPTLAPGPPATGTGTAPTPGVETTQWLLLVLAVSGVALAGGLLVLERRGS